MHKKLLNRIVCFSEDRQDISALVLIGSHARKETPADQYSDLDFIMVVDDVDSFIQSEAWIGEIARYHLAFDEPTIDGHRERRVMFDEAADVDFIFIPRENAHSAFNTVMAKAILAKGCQILVNKGGYAIPQPVQPLSAEYTAPTEAEYQNTANDFWFHTVWAAKKLLRGELWAAKFCVDDYLKWKLLWIIEHYQHAVHGAEYHTWYNGRFIDRWADAEVKEGLAKSFGGYSRKDIASALTETISLFRSLSAQVAQSLHFEYPAHADAYCSDWVLSHIRGLTYDSQNHRLG